MPTTPPWTRNEDTGCALWAGPFSRKGAPVRRDPETNRHFQVIPDAWSAYWEIVEPPRLWAVCGEKRCIAPKHHFIRKPWVLADKKGLDGRQMAAIMRDLKGREGVVFDYGGPLRDLECPKSVVTNMSRKWSISPLLVLTAYSALVNKTRPRVLSVK